MKDNLQIHFYWMFWKENIKQTPHIVWGRGVPYTNQNSTLQNTPINHFESKKKSNKSKSYSPNKTQLLDFNQLRSTIRKIPKSLLSC